ncbi:MAG: WxL domain-containing protein [Kurthia sp.]|nr:WxL domain-containing protein [Candidatus Kurthia equi]
MKLGLSAAMILALASGAVISTDAQAADGGTYESKGKVGFEANKSTNPVNPIDPTDPTKPPVKPIDPTNPDGPNPGTAGPLSIDYASSIDFGLNEISNEDKTYYANPQTYDEGTDDTANYVQVTDRRGTNAGWSLSVKQNGQFKNETTQNKELVGSTISLVDGTIASPTTNAVLPTTTAAKLDPTGTASSPIVSAAKTQGSGTFASSFGELETVKITSGDEEKDVIKNTGISLEVPGNTPKDAVDYTTSLTWILTDAPGQGK